MYGYPCKWHSTLRNKHLIIALIWWWWGCSIKDGLRSNLLHWRLAFIFYVGNSAAVFWGVLSILLFNLDDQVVIVACKTFSFSITAPFSTWSHKNPYLCALSVRHRFTYLTARFTAVSKRNVHWVALKHRLNTWTLARFYYVDTGTHCCFYYVVTETYWGGLEF